MPDVESPPPDPQRRRWVRVAQSVLTKVAHGSAPFITTFILIHLSAPVLATLGGTSLSSQVMLLGREYYQTSFGEKYLVLAPLVVHPLSSIAKRALAPRPARRLTSVLSVTGYLAILCGTAHFITHRLHPTDPSPPIFALSPSELDYEYVKYALHNWPWRSWLAYLTLTTVVARHAADGVGIIWNTWLSEVAGRWKGKARTAALWTTAMVLPVASGLFMIASEPLIIFSSTASRFHAAFAKSLLYRL